MQHVITEMGERRMEKEGKHWVEGWMIQRGGVETEGELSIITYPSFQACWSTGVDTCPGDPSDTSQQLRCHNQAG